MTEIIIDMMAPDIFCLSEHFLLENELDYFSFPSYKTAAGFCRLNMDKEGFAIFVKDYVMFNKLDVSKYCMEGYCELPAISFEFYNVSLFLLAVYRPPRRTVYGTNVFMESLNDCLESFTKRNLSVIVAGDFNIDMSKDKDRFI